MALQTSARNQFKGKVATIKLGGVMADLTIDIANGQTMSTVITRESAERLRLTEGKEVVAMVKATEVIVATES